uniref:F-actin-capping protein subunit alpha n=1 Tax=Myxobolus squamalis TaxID=59785 RepID=A0A6B2G4D8_MYXSQ
MSSITAKEKAKLASYLIKQAPPGQFTEVLSNVRTLLNDDNLFCTECLPVLQEHNELMFTPCKVVKTDGDSLITSHGRCDSKYIDNRNKLKFAVDHIKQECTSSEKFELNPTTRCYHDPIDLEISNYVKERHKNGTCAVYVTGEEPNIQIVICIERHAYNRANFWSGALLGDYRIDVEKLTLKGTITTKIHYYEDANVQLHSRKMLEESLKPFSEKKDLAAEICRIIRVEEDKYQGALDTDITHINDVTFKALRRAMPVMRTLVDWDKIFAYGIAQELTK